VEEPKKFEVSHEIYKEFLILDLELQKREKVKADKELLQIESIEKFILSLVDKSKFSPMLTLRNPHSP
jgi:hypothetical protein